MIATAVVNTVPTRTGKVRLVCQICGKLSLPRADEALFNLPSTWTMLPFPATHQHADGSVGALYRCPAHSGGGAIGHRTREYLDTPLNASR